MIHIAGADEVGLGSAAYYVYSAAVILNPERPIQGLADSKKLSPKKRQSLSDEIKEKAAAWCIAIANLEDRNLECSEGSSSGHEARN
jgi:ribonuclease HII